MALSRPDGLKALLEKYLTSLEKDYEATDNAFLNCFYESEAQHLNQTLSELDQKISITKNLYETLLSGFDNFIAQFAQDESNLLPSLSNQVLQLFPEMKSNSIYQSK